jgi:hypothetical protein
MKLNSLLNDGLDDERLASDGLVFDGFDSEDLIDISKST